MARRHPILRGIAILAGMALALLLLSAIGLGGLDGFHLGNAVAVVELEEGVEGLIHVSQLSTERVDKPAALFKPDEEVEAEVTNVDSREKRIGLSIKALRKSEGREEVDAYLKREREGGRFSLGDILPDDLPVDRELREKDKA